MKTRGGLITDRRINFPKFLLTNTSHRVIINEVTGLLPIILHTKVYTKLHTQA